MNSCSGGRMDGNPAKVDTSLSQAAARDTRGAPKRTHKPCRPHLDQRADSDLPNAAASSGPAKVDAGKTQTMPSSRKKEKYQQKKRKKAVRAAQAATTQSRNVAKTEPISSQPAPVVDASETKPPEMVDEAPTAGAVAHSRPNPDEGTAGSSGPAKSTAAENQTVPKPIARSLTLKSQRHLRKKAALDVEAAGQEHSVAETQQVLSLPAPAADALETKTPGFAEETTTAVANPRAEPEEGTLGLDQTCNISVEVTPPAKPPSPLVKEALPSGTGNGRCTGIEIQKRLEAALKLHFTKQEDDKPVTADRLPRTALTSSTPTAAIKAQKLARTLKKFGNGDPYPTIADQIATHKDRSRKIRKPELGGQARKTSQAVDEAAVHCCLQPKVVMPEPPAFLGLALKTFLLMQKQPMDEAPPYSQLEIVLRGNRVTPELLKAYIEMVLRTVQPPECDRRQVAGLFKGDDRGADVAPFLQGIWESGSQQWFLMERWNSWYLVQVRPVAGVIFINPTWKLAPKLRPVIEQAMQTVAPDLVTIVEVDGLASFPHLIPGAVFLLVDRAVMGSAAGIATREWLAETKDRVLRWQAPVEPPEEVGRRSWLSRAPPFVADVQILRKAYLSWLSVGNELESRPPEPKETPKATADLDDPGAKRDGQADEATTEETCAAVSEDAATVDRAEVLGPANLPPTDETEPITPAVATAAQEKEHRKKSSKLKKKKERKKKALLQRLA